MLFLIFILVIGSGMVVAVLTVLSNVRSLALGASSNVGDFRGLVMMDLIPVDEMEWRSR